jgi:predicted nucleic acid-binding protein
MKFVLDANVLISAALFRDSIPGLAYNMAIQKGEILISENTLNELITTLNKPKLRKYGSTGFRMKLNKLRISISFAEIGFA